MPFDGELPERSDTPRLVYLGRLKRYKRIEWLLDVVEALPDVVLDIAGEGDHRPALEAEIARRGLGDRVVLHGHVSEAEKFALYAQAWVNVTASSAEGWGLTVMEAATCGDAERGGAGRRAAGVGRGRRDGPAGRRRPGRDRGGRAARGDRALRESMGAAARERAATFTWERTARETLDLLEKTAAEPRVSLRADARALGDAEGGRDGRGDDGQQRARGDLHRALRAPARRRRTTARWRR